MRKITEIDSQAQGQCGKLAAVITIPRNVSTFSLRQSESTRKTEVRNVGLRVFTVANLPY